MYLHIHYMDLPRGDIDIRIKTICEIVVKYDYLV